MSQAGIEAFATKVVTDPDFGTALQGAIESAEGPAAEAVVAFGAQAGFTFTVEEAAAMGSALRNRFDAADPDAELADEQLETVAGGFGAFVAVMPLPPPAVMPLPPPSPGVMPIPPPGPTRLIGW